MVLPKSQNAMAVSLFNNRLKKLIVKAIVEDFSIICLSNLLTDFNNVTVKTVEILNYIDKNSSTSNLSSVYLLFLLSLSLGLLGLLIAVALYLYHVQKCRKFRYEIQRKSALKRRSVRATTNFDMAIITTPTTTISSSISDSLYKSKRIKEPTNQKNFFNVGSDGIKRDSKRISAFKTEII